MVEAMIVEMQIQKDYLEGQLLDTIYFGGGTPSILESKQINSFIEMASGLFRIDSNPEITLEANPDDLSIAKLKELYSVGINRLSIGIQSFDGEVLKFLNRAHNSKQALNCVSNARMVGFDNISTDLIFSIPGVSDDVLEKDIKSTVSLGPEHISAYSLTIEEKTVFGNWHKKGKLKLLSDHESANQFEFVISQLEENGYEQYEVSNFCRDGFYSRHNSSYWKNVNYLGIGPGAHSYNGISRQYNMPNNHAYIKSMKQGKVPFEIEELGRTARINEYILTSLRTKWGCNLKLLDEKFGHQLLLEAKDEIEAFVRKDLIKIKDETIYLTGKGILLADDIIGQLFQVQP